MKKIILLTLIVSTFNITGCTYLNSFTSSCCTIESNITKPIEAKVLYDKKGKLSLDVNIKHLLALQSREELDKYITVLDQDGNHVTHIPVINGQVSVATQFMPQILDLKYNESEVPISTVIYQACSIMQHDLKYNTITSPIVGNNKMEELILKQITWDNKRNSLLFKFKKAL